MTEDENKETSEDATPEETPAEEPQAESTEEAPAEETPQGEPRAEEAPAAEEEEPAQDDAPAEEPADAPVAEQEAADEDSEQEEAPEEAEAAEEEEPATEEAAEEKLATEEPEGEKKPEKKKDVIPGADLEPIAVDSGEERPLSAEERARQEAEEEERAQREAELVGDGVDEESTAASRAPAKMESGARFQATGKRKRSIARVTLLPGDGKFEINGRSIEEFFPRPLHQTMARQPLATTGYETSVDVRIRVHGGGIGGQAGAVRHGISRALTEIDPELRGELKRRGFLTRDARVKERRKAGLKKARKKPQFSKR
jgi:small subunit ribosomal protein S9